MRKTWSFNTTNVTQWIKLKLQMLWKCEMYDPASILYSEFVKRLEKLDGTSRFSIFSLCLY